MEQQSQLHEFKYQKPEELTFGRKNWLLIRFFIWLHPLALFMSLGIVGCLLEHNYSSAIAAALITFILEFIALHRLLWSQQRKDEFLTSKLVCKALRKSAFSAEEKSAIRFQFDPHYKQRVIKCAQHDAEYAHAKAVKEKRKELHAIEKARKKEVKRLTSERWVKVCPGFSYSEEEGLVEFSGSRYPFNEIKGARMLTSERQQHYETKQVAHTKTRPSLMGAAAGYALFGGAGAVVGALGFSKSKTTITSNAKEVSLYTFIGVEASFNGFTKILSTLPGTAEVHSSAASSAKCTAQNVIDELKRCATLPIPENVIPVEKLPSVVELDESLVCTQNQLKEIENQEIIYELPEGYEER